MSERPVWQSGVGGAQCDDCDVTTIVRSFGDRDEVWLCRACYEGWDDEYELAPVASAGSGNPE